MCTAGCKCDGKNCCKNIPEEYYTEMKSKTNKDRESVKKAVHYLLARGESLDEIMKNEQRMYMILRLF